MRGYGTWGPDARFVWGPKIRRCMFLADHEGDHCDLGGKTLRAEPPSNLVVLDLESNAS